MTHSTGTYLGGIRHLHDLRDRCYVDPAGCWHLRTARGRPMPKGSRHVIWVYEKGCVSVPKAAMELAGRSVPNGHVAYRTCTSYDCANPEHMSTRTRSDHSRTVGAGHIATKTVANRVAGAKRSKVSPQGRARLAYSQERLVDLAREFGISVSWASAIRARERQKTVADVVRAP